MFDYLERLRSKPRSYRQKFALVFASSITGVIVVAWVLAFSSKVQNQKPIDAENSPFSGLKNTASSIMEGIGNFKVDLKPTIKVEKVGL